MVLAWDKTSCNRPTVTSATVRRQADGSSQPGAVAADQAHEGAARPVQVDQGSQRALTGVPLTGVLETVVFARPEKCFPGMRKPWLSDPNAIEVFA